MFPGLDDDGLAHHLGLENLGVGVAADDDVDPRDCGGQSQRMGTAKPLLPIQGRPAVTRCLESLRDSEVADIVLVVNPEGGDIATAAKDIPARIVVNELPGSDMAASVKAGLTGIDREATGVLVCLCDHPLVRPGNDRSDGLLACPTSRRDHHPRLSRTKRAPDAVPPFVLEDLGKVATLRDVIGHHNAKITLLDVDDEGVTLWNLQAPLRTIGVSWTDTAPERFTPSR